ncbi:uncharacterized protein [Primulina huaijiensis]|uniref:uncharacterized protein n=1 Tax=Primulina huaijiensis TaxID=1492673 RepID=UPI003CC78991
MESLYFVEYCGKTIETTVTNKASVAEKWLLNRMRSLELNGGLENRVAGVGCKCFPPLNPADSSIFTKKIATLQLCMDTKCLVLQLPHMDYIPAQCFIRNLLANSGVITFVGVEVQKMWNKIMSEYGIECLRCECKVVDAHFLVKAWFPMSYRGRPTLKALAYGVAGLSMRKSTVGKCYRYGADWGAKILDEELVQQACVDAYALYEIALTLLKDP